MLVGLEIDGKNVVRRRDPTKSGQIFWQKIVTNKIKLMDISHQYMIVRKIAAILFCFSNL